MVEKHLLSRLERRAQHSQCSVDELLERWLDIDDQHGIDQLLLFAGIVKEMPASLVVIDPNQTDHPIVFSNQECESVTGYSPPELLGQPLQIFQNGNDDQPALEILRNAIAQRRPCNVTLHSYRKDGTPFENELSLKPLFDAQHQVTHFVAIQQDITAHEAAARISERYHTELAALFNNPSNAVLITDDNGIYIDCNAVACDVFGSERADLIGSSVANFVVLSNDAAMENVWAQFMERGYQEGESVIRRSDGVLRTMEYRSYAHYRHGEHISFLRDITEQKRVQHALEQSETRSRLIMELMTTYAFTLNVLPDGTLQREWITPNAFQKLTGFTAEESAARGGWATLPHPEDRPLVQQALQEHLNGTVETQAVYRIITKAGDIRYLSSINRALKDAADRVTYIYGASKDITEQKLAQRALEKSEFYNRIISELSSHASFLTAVLPDGSVTETFIPDTFFKLTGYTLEELQARGGWKALIHPDDQRSVKESLNSLYVDHDDERADSAIIENTFRFTHKAGDTRYFTATSRSIKNVDEPGWSVFNSIRDVTERKQWEDALLYSEERFRRLIEMAPTAIVVINQAGQMLLINQQFEGLFGYERDELIGRSIELLLPELSRDPTRTYQADFFRRFSFHPTSTAQEMTGRHKDGTSFLIEVGLSYIDSYTNNEASTFAVAFLTDITARKRAEQELAYSAALIQSSHDAIIGKTLDGMIASWNPGAEKIYGYTAEEIIGKPISLLVPVGCFNEVPEILDQIIDHYETVRMRKDGTNIDIALTVSPIRSVSGRITGASVIARDITESKRQARIQEQQNRLLSKVLLTIPDVIQIGDILWERVVYTNRSILKVLGYKVPNNAPTSQVLSAYIHPDDLVQFKSRSTAFTMVKDGDIDAYEYRMRGADGKWHWFFVRETIFMRNKDGSPRQLISSTQDISARKNAEIALQESEHQYRLLADNVIDVIVQVDANVAVKYISPSVEPMLGYPIADWIGKSVLSWVHPDDQARLISDAQSIVLRGGGTQRAEYRMRHKVGYYVWIEMASRVRDNTPNALSVTIWRDITTRKYAEKALVESERFAHATVDALSAQIAILDQDGIILMVNREWRVFAQANGMKPGYRWEGLNYLAVCDRSGAQIQSGTLAANGIHSVINGECDKFEYEYLCHDPTEERWYIMQVTRFLGDGPIRVVVAHENITSRKLAENALRASEERYQRVVEDQLELICRYDKDFKILFANQAYLKSFSGREKVVGTSLFDWIPEGGWDSTRPMYAELSVSNPLYTTEYQHRMSDGTLHWIRWNIQALYDETGHLTEYQNVGYDVTERKQAEEKLAYYQAHLEELVVQRTAELADSNAQLQIEMNERRLVEAAERQQRVLAEALRNIAVSLNKQNDLSAVLDEIIVNIEQVISHESASLIFLSGDKTQVVRANGSAANELFPEGSEQLLAESPILVAMQDRHEHLLISNVRVHPLGMLLSQVPEVRSCIGVPMINAGEVIGFIILYSAIADYFEYPSVARLKMFAEQATVAVYNAQFNKQYREIAVWRERQQIARNLHDAVTQTMFSASIIAETLLKIWETEPAKVPNGLQQLHRLTRGAVAEARNLLFELRPEALADADLSRLVVQISDAFEGKTGIKPTIKFPSDLQIPRDVKITFYWIIHEALSNIAKHAKANVVSIELAVYKKTINLSISDDGQGFVTTATNSTQLGLNIMHERVDAINAKLHIFSKLHQGTVIVVDWQGDIDGK